MPGLLLFSDWTQYTGTDVVISRSLLSATKVGVVPAAERMIGARCEVRCNCLWVFTLMECSNV